VQNGIMKQKIEHFVKPFPEDYLNLIDRGWGNGYVVLPPDHPWFGLDYDQIDVDVHGGLTFGKMTTNLTWGEIEPNWLNCYIIGFDTAHYQDNLDEWPKERVIEETLRLKEQCIQAYESNT